ncbi:hypothetical protein SLAVM298S_07231 [Streptomyces lavendulae subsp. lavendulae]
MAAAVIGGAAFAFAGTAQATWVGAVYAHLQLLERRCSGQCVVADDAGQAQEARTLQFDLQQARDRLPVERNRRGFPATPSP